MTRIRNVRTTTKFKRSVKAISPVIATLLMIAIAVVASLVVYAWVTGYMGNTTDKAGKAIQIQSTSRDGTSGLLTVYVQNVGQGVVEFKSGESVYVNDNLVRITSVLQPLAAGKTAELLTNYVISENQKDERIDIKVTTTDGTFMTKTGTVPSSSGGSTPAPTTPPSGNAAPVLTAIGPKSIDELTLLSFTALATDSDVPAQTLTFSLQGSVPSGAAITGAGAFTWTPTEAQGPGSYQITVRVTDNGAGSLFDEETITVTVNEVATANTAPVLTAIGPKSIDELTLLSFTALATDSDVPAQTLTFSLQGSVPSGAAITGAGAFTWTPTEAQGPGSYQITVRVTDNGAGSLFDEETITVTVNEVSATPITDLRSPTSDSDSGWDNEDRAYVNGGGSNGFGTSDRNDEWASFGGYGFAVPSGATNIQVHVRVDAWVTSGGSDNMRLEVYDGSWRLSTEINLPTSEGETWYDVTSLSPGGWTYSEVNNIQTRVTHIETGGSDENIYLDWIPVEVVYTP